jgi:type III secretory pathway component EscU
MEKINNPCKFATGIVYRLSETTLPVTCTSPELKNKSEPIQTTD